MLKIPRNLSINISMAVSVALFIICIYGLFELPSLTNVLINLPDNIGDRNAITQLGRTAVLIVAYCIDLTVTLANVLLFGILFRVKKGLVFTEHTVALIRGVSWCCVMLCFCFALLTRYFQLAWLVAFLAVFLGICLRVVKNVIEEATCIKNENDLTV